MLKAKVIVMMAFMSALFVGAVVMRVNEFEVANRENLANSKMKSQTNAVSQAMSHELQSLQRQIASLFDFRKEKINWLAMKPYDGLGQLSLLQGAAQVQTFLTSDRSTSAFLDPATLNRIIGQVDSVKVHKGTVYVRAFQDNEKNRHVALVVGTELRTFVFVGPGDNIQALVDAQKGSGIFAIVNSVGGVLAHTTSEYVGKSMAEDPLFAEIKKTGSNFGFTSYVDRNGKSFFGLYQLIPNSDAYILNSVPKAEFLLGQKALLSQFALMGAGFFVITAALLLFMLKDSTGVGGSGSASGRGRQSDFVPVETSMPTAWPELPDAKGGKSKGVSMGSSVDPMLANAKAASSATVAAQAQQSPTISANDKLKAYMKIASAVGHELHGPLIGILGQAQNLKTDSENKSVKSAAENILREARLARELLDKLFAFAGETQAEKTKVKFEVPLLAALKTLELRLNQKQIKVTKNIQSKSEIEISVPLVTKAIENIISNSIEAMDRMIKKDLTINLTEKNGNVILVVTDVGEGIEPKNLEKIYDPFFTTRSYANHVGLGLPFTLGVCREHLGKMEIESSVGKGTTVTMEFPIQLARQSTPKIDDTNATIVMKDSEPKMNSEGVENEEKEFKFVIPKNLPNPGEPPPLKIPEGQSPTEFNVEHLFELPDEVVASNEEVEAGYEGTHSGYKEKNNTKKEDTDLPDGFEMMPAAVSKKPSSATDATIALPMDDAPMMVASDIGTERKTKIDEPNFQAPVNKSELDNFQVNIRRPGMRS